MAPSALPHPLPDELVTLLAERLVIFGHPTRIQILDRLRFGEANVQSIADTLATTQQNVSGHLRLLRAMGVVSYRREGRESFYAVADETVFDVWERALTGLREPEH